MPIYSMTGYASAQTELASDTANSPALRLGLEIRSVNSRFLDLTFKMPEELRQHEAAMRELVTKHLKRGNVTANLTIRREETTRLAPDPAAIEQALALATALAARIPGAPPPPAAGELPHEGLHHQAAVEGQAGQQIEEGKH
jgi:uncharacterized protein (TIGR00255 family)